MTLAQSIFSSPELRLIAPVDGVIVPLEDLPDAVFAEKMLGDGIAIDPTGSRALAPCSGVITQIHRALHALTIRTDEGVSVLLHVGLDTVTLEGKGFTALVKEGERVEVGQEVLKFDLDAIAQNALSAQVEIVITEGGESFTFKHEGGTVRAGEDTILCISKGPNSQARPMTARSSEGQSPDALSEETSSEGLSPEESAATERSTVRRTATIVNPHGMHARPAARLVQIAKKFDAEITIAFAEKTASARSVADIMALDLGALAAIEIITRGSDAQAAADALSQAISDGLGEKPGKGATTPQAVKLSTDEEGVIGGIPASPGIALGTVVIRDTSLPEFDKLSASPGAELPKLTGALEKVRATLAAEEAAFKELGESEKAQIFAAHRELLEDDGLLGDARSSIEGKGASAAQGWVSAIEQRVETLGSLKNQILRQRAADMKDIGRRVLFAILDTEEPEIVFTQESILVCDDLTPSTAAGLDAERIGGIITELGGSTSHAAIIARSLGVPYVAGIGAEISSLVSGLQVIVNGGTGAIIVDPDDAAIEKAEAEIERQKEARAVEQKRAHEKAVTRDGFEVEVGANIGNAKDSQDGVARGCDGVGLLRSEFLFLGRREAPSEDEQRAEYEEIARTLGPTRSLVIRTLDVGGDKRLAYMPLAEEENPFLGIRGLRLSFKFPDLFRSQIRAALAAVPHSKLHLMFPMVAQPSEFTKARKIVLEEIDRLHIDPKKVAIGVMVEVPSAALNARWLAREADFFSIGTNDLTQYTLAMDRGHSELSHQADAFDPAVLRLIQMTVQAAHAEGKWVGICGGLAAEPLATPLLLGLDVNELSVPAPVIPELKARIRRLDHQSCRAVAEGALALPSATHVRQLLSSFLR